MSQQLEMSQVPHTQYQHGAKKMREHVMFPLQQRTIMQPVSSITSSRWQNNNRQETLVQRFQSAQDMSQQMDMSPLTPTRPTYKASTGIGADGTEMLESKTVKSLTVSTNFS